MLNDWKLIIDGDKKAFINLYEREYQALFAYGFRISMDRELTKDCIQELFLEIWNRRVILNAEVRDTRSYLFTWLRRKMAAELNRFRKERSTISLEESDTEISYEEILIAFQQSEEKKEELRRALKKLTKKQLQIIQLKFYQNLSYHIIAEQTMLSPRTVYNLAYEALRHLRETMHLVFIYSTL